MTIKDVLRRMAKAWLEAMEAGRLTPPRDVHDASAWDAYWRNHLPRQTVASASVTWMSSDERLVGFLTRRGAATILCAGNGLSSEAVFDGSGPIPSQLCPKIRRTDDTPHSVAGACGSCPVI